MCNIVHLAKHSSHFLHKEKIGAVELFISSTETSKNALEYNAIVLQGLLPDHTEDKTAILQGPKETSL